MTINMLKEILQQYFETYNDQTSYPFEDYPELEEQLESIKQFLEMN